MCVDGAFVPFAEDFDLNKVTPRLRHLGTFGVPEQVDLNRPVGSYVGLRVLKEGRTTGLTKGTIMAAFVEHEDATGLNISQTFSSLETRMHLLTRQGTVGAWF